MFTPQRGWFLTPNKSGARGTGSGSDRDLGPSPSSGDAAGSKGKGVAFAENGGNLDREVLVEKISNLEKEVSSFS